MQHEFLFLLTNSVDRLDLILKNHKVDFKSNKMPIAEDADEGITQNIHLLSDSSFINQAPHRLVNEIISKNAIDKLRKL